MPVGWQTITDSGVVQLDQDTKCYQLVASGSGTFSSTVPMAGGGGYATVVVTNAVAPLVAIGLASGICAHAVRKIHVSGTTWTYYFSGGSGDSFDYYVFDHSATLIENFGLAIYDGSGVLTYQSGGKPLRIVGMGPDTYTSGRTYAAVALEFRSLFDAIEDDDNPGDYIFTYTAYGPYQDANVFSDVNIDVSSGTTTGAPATWDNGPAPFLVVDVTNY